MSLVYRFSTNASLTRSLFRELELHASGGMPPDRREGSRIRLFYETTVSRGLPSRVLSRPRRRFPSLSKVTHFRAKIAVSNIYCLKKRSFIETLGFRRHPDRFRFDKMSYKHVSQSRSHGLTCQTGF